MCGSTAFKLLGLRMDGRQGLRPQEASGIGVSIKQCRNCGLIFSDPQPRPQSISDHYGMPPEEYWQTEDLDPHPGYMAVEISTAKRLLNFRPGMTALDIGAGVGKAMVALDSAGFQTWGIEPSEPFYQRAIRRVSPDRLQMQSVEDADFPADTFDFITFGAVLEHLYSPREALDQAMGWLKPGGIIHAEVPSADYLISKLFNRYFRFKGTRLVTHLSPMHPPFHLFEFTRKSFEQRYKLADYSHYVCDILNVPAVLHPPLKWWMSHTGSGMEIVVYLTK
jgi:SAM-dependent methyltransferase